MNSRASALGIHCLLALKQSATVTKDQIQDLITHLAQECNDIEEFCTEISQQLREIQRALRDLEMIMTLILKVSIILHSPHLT